MRHGLLALIDPMGTHRPLRERANGEVARVKRLLQDLKSRHPHGNVAHYWLPAGFIAAASWVDSRTAALRRTAPTMTSESGITVISVVRASPARPEQPVDKATS